LKARTSAAWFGIVVRPAGPSNHEAYDHTVRLPSDQRA
jgi:hypothetical protein